MYNDRFKKVGKFTGEHPIVLKTNSNPIIHAPRKCLLHHKDEIKAELRIWWSN